MIPHRTVEARTLTREWAPDDWPYPEDATVVHVIVDGHLVGEVVVTEGPDQSNRDQETRPHLTMRGVRVQEAGLIGDRDVFPVTVAHQGDRTAEALR